MKTCIALGIVCLIVFLSIFTLPVKAQEPLNLTIKPDGIVEPFTDLLERNGIVYTFKGDIFGTIWVQTNNIIIDGAGHTLRGNGSKTGKNTEIGILLGGSDLSHRVCHGVIVENLKISGSRGIYSVGGSNNSFLGNYFENSGIEFFGNANQTGDIVKHNTFVNASISFDYNPNGTDCIVENNLIDSRIGIWLAKEPIVDRNYWSNYSAQNPDAKELDNSGVWDTPYVYQSTDDSAHLPGAGSRGKDQPCIDHQPLVNPITDFEIPNFSLFPSATPTSQLPTINTGAEPPKTEPFPTILIAVVSIVAVALVAAGLLVYHKKHIHNLVKEV
jgi:hypothetical protein